MLKKAIITLVLSVAAACVYGGANDPASDAKALFEQGQYKEGLDVLNLALRKYRMEPLSQVHVRESLAEFYEDYVGNYGTALRQYKQILKAPLPADDPMKSLAQKEISRLEALDAEHSRQNALLRKLRSSTSRRQDEAEIKEQVARLETFIKDNSEYYRLAEACYYLGLDYMSLNKFGKACKVFERCAQLRPAIDFYLPVKARFDVAHARWIDATVNAIVWRTLGAIWLFVMIVFYMSRPWRWVKLRHIIGGLVMVFLWWAVFNISYICFGRRLEFTDTVIEQIQVELPAFVSASPGSLGSEVSKQLFLYGLVALWGMFMLAIGTSRFKHRWLTLMINPILGLLLFACLTSVFYLRYCNNKSTFNSQAKNELYYPKGVLYFAMQEPEPYVLTNPKAYPNLKTSKAYIGDDYLREWIIRYCPIDRPNEEAGQSKPE